MLATLLFTGEEIFTATTPKNPQSDRLYAHLSTKKKDVTTKRLHTMRSVSDSISRRVTSG